MANVITQVEMMKYRGSSVACFPAGTILTPSAKDWAKEQGITVTFGDGAQTPAATDEDLLNQVVAAVVAQFKANGRSLDKNELVAAVEEVLKRLNK